MHRGLIEETLICDLQLHNILVSERGDYLRIFNRAKEAAIKISRGPVNQPMGAAADSGLPSSINDPLGQRQYHRPDRTKILRSHEDTEVTHHFRPVPLHYRIGLRALGKREDLLNFKQTKKLSNYLIHKVGPPIGPH
jgi:hypothetical protein